MTKTNSGNYFEDFRIGQLLMHATPRTITSGDVALYNSLFGARFPLTSSDEFARELGLPRSPVDELLVFHMVFGKTVPDVSLNAVANLGYADFRWLKPVWPGDTIVTTSTVIGLKENSNKQSGVVYVRSVGRNQKDESVLDYVRWVMVRKRDAAAAALAEEVPRLPDVVSPDALEIPAELSMANYNDMLAGSPHRWDDYQAGEKIDHVDGVTIEEAEHQIATRLYQNNAKVHFNQHVQGQDRLGRRLIYGGHIISIVRALTFNGLGNALQIAAINGGRHTNPMVAGDTIYAWTEVLAVAEIAGRLDLGALRLRSVAVKNRNAAEFPDKDADGKYPPDVVLDLDYWVLMPRSKAA
jgi:2-methylfumaryl-CoA hydratase